MKKRFLVFLVGLFMVFSAIAQSAVVRDDNFEQPWRVFDVETNIQWWGKEEWGTTDKYNVCTMYYQQMDHDKTFKLKFYTDTNVATVEEGLSGMDTITCLSDDYQILLKDCYDDEIWKVMCYCDGTYEYYIIDYKDLTDEDTKEFEKMKNDFISQGPYVFMDEFTKWEKPREWKLKKDTNASRLYHYSPKYHFYEY